MVLSQRLRFTLEMCASVRIRSTSTDDKLACRISTQLQSWNDKRVEAEAEIEAETEVGIAGAHALLLLVHLIFTSPRLPVSHLSVPGKSYTQPKLPIHKTTTHDRVIYSTCVDQRSFDVVVIYKVDTSRSTLLP